MTRANNKLTDDQAFELVSMYAKQLPKGTKVIAISTSTRALIQCSFDLPSQASKMFEHLVSVSDDWGHPGCYVARVSEEGRKIRMNKC